MSIKKWETDITLTALERCHRRLEVLFHYQNFSGNTGALNNGKNLGGDESSRA